MPNRTIHSDSYLKWLEKHGQELPEHIEHGTEAEIRERLKPLKVSNWRTTGPGRLEGDTKMGPFVQFIDPKFICVGTDKDDMPILRDVTQHKNKRTLKWRLRGYWRLIKRKLTPNKQ